MTNATDDTPAPVPGFERLIWREEVVRIPVEPRTNFMAQLVARGDDAGIVFAGGRSSFSEVSSISLEGAFSSWPPRVGAVAVHALRDLVNRPPRIARWVDDQLIYLGEEPFAAKWGVAGSTSLGIDVGRRNELGQVLTRPPSGYGRSFVGADPAHGIYVVRSRSDEECLVEYRKSAATAVAIELGVLPGAGWGVGAVLADGSFLYPASRPVPDPSRARADRGGAPPRVVELFLVHHESVESLGELAVPPDTHLAALVASPAGGAWALFQGHGTAFVQRVGPGISAPAHAVPFAACGGNTQLMEWSHGCVLRESRGGEALVASDGAHATRVAGRPPGEAAFYDSSAAVVALDGSCVLVVSQASGGLQVHRADFQAGEAASDIWDADRGAAARAQEHAARRAEERRYPGTPLETGKDGKEPPRFHAKSRLVERARLQFLLKNIYCLHNEAEPNAFTGTSEEGRFWDVGWSGGLTLITWSRNGLVAGGFDGRPRYFDVYADDYHPMAAGNLFPDVPEDLDPLVHDVLDTMSEHLSGGLWVTTGEHARFHKEGSFSGDFSRYTMTAAAALSSKRGGSSWAEDMAPWGPVAAQLAAKAALGPHTVTPEEEAAILAVPDGGREPDPGRVARAVQALAAAGITWRPARAANRV